MDISSSHHVTRQQKIIEGSCRRPSKTSAALLSEIVPHCSAGPTCSRPTCRARTARSPATAPAHRDPTGRPGATRWYRPAEIPSPRTRTRCRTLSVDQCSPATIRPLLAFHAVSLQDGLCYFEALYPGRHELLPYLLLPISVSCSGPGSSSSFCGSYLTVRVLQVLGALSSDSCLLRFLLSVQL